MKSKFVCLVAAVTAGVLGMAEFSEAKTQTGLASYYKSGKLTANGERFNPHGLTAAHPSLAFGTKVKVTIIKSGKSVIVRINDRGPFTNARIIDLSLGAAKVIGLDRSGIAKVKFLVMEAEGAGPDRAQAACDLFTSIERLPAARQKLEIVTADLESSVACANGGSRHHLHTSPPARP